ncbi:hypothetical protein Drorol1_Dr00020952 [Drosera rotundifolia]
MFMASYPKLVLLLFCVVSLAEATNASVTDPTSCNDMCGNMSIPYPFGITEGCYLNDDFLVDCNTTTGIPYLWKETWNHQVLNFSLDGQLLIYTYVGNNCYSGNISVLSLSHPRFPFSKTRNKFTALGCDTYAHIEDTKTNSTTGCSSICQQKDVENGSCSGAGCCQTSVPETDMLNFKITVASFSNHTQVSHFSPCSYAFLVDQDYYTFSISDLENFTNVVPTTLDWAIGNQTCEEAFSSGEYVCGSNTSCVDTDNGPGYRCSCSSGFQGNPYLPNGCQDIDECKDPDKYPCKKKCINTFGSYNCTCEKGYHGDTTNNLEACVRDQWHLSRAEIIGIVIASVGAVLGSFILCFSLEKRKRAQQRERFFKQNGGHILESKLKSREGSMSVVKIYPIQELEKATHKFDDSRIIGHGGFGTVYKGYLSDGKVVAIKKSKIVDQRQIDQFINEVMVLSQINHRNVVKFLGSYLENPVPLLVYELITNRTLSDHIHKRKSSQLPLPWEHRLRIASETAGLLDYLHSAHSTPVIHRDVKPTNILLDDDYTAKVADFGSSRLVPMDETQMCTMVQGTLGYLDPEYLHTGQLAEKSDVYSFGVVLVELLTGQKAVSFERGEKETNLVKYFLSTMKKDRIQGILDKHITNAGNIKQLVEAANIAKACLKMKGEERPSMKEVAMELEGLRMESKHKQVGDGSQVEEADYLLGRHWDSFAAGSSTAPAFGSTGDGILMVTLDDGR